MDERMKLLHDAVGRHGQAAAARAMGYSPSAVNQALHGKYGGSLDNLLDRVEEIYGDTFVNCPILGEIALKRCADNRKRPFAATSPLRVRLWKACQECKNNG